MVSNLSTIGLAFADDGVFNAAMGRLAAGAERRVTTPVGDYAVWRSSSAAELWFHMTPGNPEPIGLTPFFDGRSKAIVRATERIKRPEDSPFEGALLAWMAPGADGAGAYPFVFDAVDFAALAGHALPADLTVRIAGFAHQVRAFPTPGAYEATQTSDPKFAAQSFLPIGMFAAAAPDAGAAQSPASTALLTGRVAAHRRLTNEETGQAFHWLLVDSFESSFDIVADPEAVEGEIVENGVVEVSCWLFGRTLA